MIENKRLNRSQPGSMPASDVANQTIGPDNYTMEYKEGHDQEVCELCRTIKDMNDLIMKARKSEIMTQFKAMEKAYLQLQKTHKKCAVCELCFGGNHLMSPSHIAGIGDVCEWCVKEIKKKGIDSVRKRMERDKVKP